MTPTSAGQFRKVRYTDEGCYSYQCLWCHNQIEIRDNPQYGWNFCPICGKSWFTQLQCRDHDTPRWYYDCWGERAEPEDRVTLSTGEVMHPDSLPFWGRRLEPKRKWIIEERTKWFDKDWGEWKFEYAPTIYSLMGSWRFVKSGLQVCRDGVDRHPDEPISVQFEYRARIVNV